MRGRELLLPVPPRTLTPFGRNIDGFDEREPLHHEQTQTSQRLGGGFDGDRAEDRLPAGEDLDVRLGADENDAELLCAPVQDDRGGMPSHLGAVGLVHRRGGVRQGRVVQRQASMRDPGRGRLGGEQEQPRRRAGPEHGIGDDERNVTIIVEKGGTDLVGSKRRAQTVVECQGQQQRVGSEVHVEPE